MAWPLPALLAWLSGWAASVGARAVGAQPAFAFVIAASLGAGLAVKAGTPWRRVFVAAGFPLSFIGTGVGGAMPAWTWLVLLGLLFVAYPRRAWRDAPLFPTPAGALRGLAASAPLPAGARLLDAGCGLGAGLAELHREYPTAVLFGIEWSWPLRIVCGWRCRFAAVRRADLWRASWSGYDLVYLFQRPESMARAIAKASGEMAAGCWLASLEFPALALQPDRVLDGADGRPVWLYRLPFTAAEP
ncbi:MAG: class I SAM-dependent methyltransferase [Rhizobacter sp.]